MAEDGEFGGLAAREHKVAAVGGGRLRCAYRRDGGVDGKGDVLRSFAANRFGSSIHVIDGDGGGLLEKSAHT